MINKDQPEALIIEERQWSTMKGTAPSSTLRSIPLQEGQESSITIDSNEYVIRIFQLKPADQSIVLHTFHLKGEGVFGKRHVIREWGTREKPAEWVLKNGEKLELNSQLDGGGVDVAVWFNTFS